MFQKSNKFRRERNYEALKPLEIGKGNRKKEHFNAKTSKLNGENFRNIENATYMNTFLLVY